MSNSTRQSNSYEERYAVPLEASRRGAHRARVSPVMAVLPIVAVVAIVIGAIALVYVFFNGMGGSGSSGQATVATSPTAAATPTGAAVAGAATDSSSAAPSGSASGTVDKTVTVAVYNGTTVGGLAKKASAKVSAAGFTLGTVATWTGTPVTGTTVFVKSEDQRATAEAIITALGGKGTVKVAPETAGVGIAVVVGNDYPGIGVGGAAPTHTSLHTRTTTRPSTHSSTSSTSATATTSSIAG